MQTTLISAERVAAQLQDDHWLVVDCRFSLADPEAGQRAYIQGHIPRARYAHLDRDLSGPRHAASGRHPLPDPDALAARLGSWGIGNDTQVVAYDDGAGAFAARLWWLLRWLGHAGVAVLDGGWKAWTAQHLPVTGGSVHGTSRPFTRRAALSHPVDTAFVATLSAAGKGGHLVDARAPARYAGYNEPIDKVAGHIPGAINIPFERNLNDQGTFRTAQQLRELYTPHLPPAGAHDLVAMCGSGVTACHTLLALEHAGLPGAKLYAGSWSEWIADPSRPVARNT